jgi:hypothetical protein
VDDELTAMAAGAPGPRDMLRELHAAVAELNADRRARWQKHAESRERALEAWAAANEAAGLPWYPDAAWWAAEPPECTFY